MVKSLLEACRTKDKAPSADTKIAAAILIGFLEGLFIQWILDRSAFNFKEAAKLSTKIIIDALKKGD